MENRQVGNFIAERRKKKGWSQKDLASVLHVTDKAVSRWERGVGYPDVTLLKPLAAALDVSVTEIMEGKELEEMRGTNGQKNQAGQTSQARQARHALEISLEKYLDSAASERKPLRQAIMAALLWAHVWVGIGVILAMVWQENFPVMSETTVIGWVFSFGSLAGMFFMDRVRKAAVECGVLCARPYEYKDPEEKREYGDYPDVTAGPMYSGPVGPRFVVFKKDDGTGLRVDEIVMALCKLVNGIFCLVFWMMAVGEMGQYGFVYAMAAFLAPFFLAGLFVLGVGCYTYAANRDDPEEMARAKRQMKMALVCVIVGIVVMVVMALASGIYWEVIVPWRASRRVQ